MSGNGNVPPPEAERYQKRIRNDLRGFAAGTLRQHSGPAIHAGPDIGIIDAGLRFRDRSLGYMASIRLPGLPPAIKINLFHTGRPEGLVTAYASDRPGDFTKQWVVLPAGAVAKAESTVASADEEMPQEELEMRRLHLGTTAVSLEQMRLRDAGVPEQPVSAGEALFLMELAQEAEVIAP